MVQRYIFLLSGKMRAGKDTIADVLLTKNPSCVRIALADELKKIARECYGWDGKKDYKGRILLQRIGTECGRFYNENIWVNKVIEKIKQDMAKDYVITDCRFVNEYTELDNFAEYTQYNLVSIRTIRPVSFKNKIKLVCSKSFWHSSEREHLKIPFDILINNNQGFEEFKVKIGKMIDDIYGGWPEINY